MRRMNMPRPARLLPLLLLAGCIDAATMSPTQVGQGVSFSPGGLTQGMTLYNPVPDGDAVGPPPNLVNLPPGTNRATFGTRANGAYAGRGRNTADPGGMCASNIRITNFVVNGDQVSFGAFRGSIQDNGTLDMQAGDAYVYGQFTGAHFDGRFWTPPPSCTYAISLDPA